MSRLADLNSHHIEGFAHAALAAGRNGQFKVPLISHIEGGLWMGGCEDGVSLDHDFDLVISCYPWEKYALGPATRRIEARLYDRGELPDDMGAVYTLADMVVAALGEGKRVLVHCQAGLNRSGLIAGLALVLLGREPADAIALLRERRHRVVLCNTTFERFLLSLAMPEPAAPERHAS